MSDCCATCCRGQAMVFAEVHFFATGVVPNVGLCCRMLLGSAQTVVALMTFCTTTGRGCQDSAQNSLFLPMCFLISSRNFAGVLVLLTRQSLGPCSKPGRPVPARQGNIAQQPWGTTLRTSHCSVVLAQQSLRMSSSRNFGKAVPAQAVPAHQSLRSSPCAAVPARQSQHSSPCAAVPARRSLRINFSKAAQQSFPAKDH